VRLHPADEAPYVRNLANQVGALPAFAEGSAGRRLPLTWCWFYIAHGATHGVEHALRTLPNGLSIQTLAPRVALGTRAIVFLGVELGVCE
jgi:hypothetical protein